MSGAGKFIAAILAAAGVPLTIVAIQQGVADPWFALLVLALYELLVGAVSLVVSVMGETIRRRLVQLADFIDLALGRTFSRYARHYRGYVLETNTHIKARDLAFTPSKMPELDAVYVDVGLAPGSPSLRSGGILPHGPDDGRERHPIHELLDHEEPAVLAVIGAPGGGKTTLLRHTAARAAAAKKKRQRRRVPVMVALRDHAELISNAPETDLADLIRIAVDLAFKEPKGWWEVQLREGNCIILLDGLDEVARKIDRATVSEWIERQISKHSANDFVITSRPHGYQTAVIPRATVLQVRPFTTKQINDFVHAWCLATERLGAGKTGPGVDRRASEEAEDLLSHLARSSALQDLAVNPLLLTMMVLVHRERRALPSGRADLYKQVCDVMLWRRMESKMMEVEPSGGARQRILASLAYEMMLAQTRDFTRSDVLAVFDRVLQSIDTDVSAEALLESIVDSSGLLVERERDLFAFSHHTLCEYLASEHVREHGLVSVLIREIGNPWWRETTLLYVTDTKADEIVEACLERDTGASLSLAFDCIRNHGRVNRVLRKQLDNLRRQAFTKGASREHRRRIARALAVGHLSKLVALDNGTLICPEPIPEDLYWLFCKDTGTMLPDGFRGLDLDARRMALGMWREEAVRFVAWLNETAAERRGGTYRLPAVAEVDLMLDGGLKPAYRLTMYAPVIADSDYTEPNSPPTLRDLAVFATQVMSADDRRRLVAGLLLADAVQLARGVELVGRPKGAVDRLVFILKVVTELLVEGGAFADPFKQATSIINAQLAFADTAWSGLGQAKKLRRELIELYEIMGATATGVGRIILPDLGTVAYTESRRRMTTGLALDRALDKVEQAYLVATSTRTRRAGDTQPGLESAFFSGLLSMAQFDGTMFTEPLGNLALHLREACHAFDSARLKTRLGPHRPRADCLSELSRFSCERQGRPRNNSPRSGWPPSSWPPSPSVSVFGERQDDSVSSRTGPPCSKSASRGTCRWRSCS
jgi:hypothetical protein